MSENVIILIAFIEIIVANLLGVYIIWQQIQQLKYKSSLQTVKWLLLASVVFLILSTLPLGVVYANSLWFHREGLLIINIAILGNATAVLLVKVLLLLMYRYRVPT